MSVRVHRGDLRDLSRYQVSMVAVDTEAMGLEPHRDRLCLVQLSPGDGTVDVVRIGKGQTSAPNLGLPTAICRHEKTSDAAWATSRYARGDDGSQTSLDYCNNIA